MPRPPKTEPEHLAAQHRAALQTLATGKGYRATPGRRALIAISARRPAILAVTRCRVTAVLIAGAAAPRAKAGKVGEVRFSGQAPPPLPQRGRAGICFHPRQNARKQMAGRAIPSKEFRIRTSAPPALGIAGLSGPP